MRFSCSCTRINVVRLVSSFRREAPTYVQVFRVLTYEINLYVVTYLANSSKAKLSSNTLTMPL